MFTFKIETFNRIVLELTRKESQYQIISITGLNPPNAQINSSSVAGMDGAIFNSSLLDPRNVVITIKINGDVEKNRLLLYKYFRTKEKCKIFYQNSSLNVYIEGFVETLELNHFENSQTAQISIICLNPYFKDLKTIVDDISKIIKLFSFPFSITEPTPISEININRVSIIINSSESETSLLIKVRFRSNMQKLEIKNIITGEQMIINYPFIKDDYLVISCYKGSKYVKLLRNGKEYNLIPYLLKGSIFFQLRIGENRFSYLADEGKKDHLLSIQFEHYNVYRGV